MARGRRRAAWCALLALAVATPEDLLDPETQRGINLFIERAAPGSLVA